VPILLQDGGDAAGTGPGQQQRQQQDQQQQRQQQEQEQQLPPGYGKYLHAHIRSVREPARKGHELVAPPPEDGWGAAAGGDELRVLKAALARQAADYVAQQIRWAAAQAFHFPVGGGVSVLVTGRGGAAHTRCE
jgi:hypothetical protein